MKRSLVLVTLLCLFAGALLVASDAQAQPRPCPPGYFWDGPRGCMPMGPPMAPPPPPMYRPCPPGTVWQAGACRPVPPPPPYWGPAPGITIQVPPIVIRP